MHGARLLSVVTRGVIVCVAVLLTTGCANFNTVGRTNELPSPTYTLSGPNAKRADGIPVSAQAISGKAIHLDAPQRLAFINALGQFCAEPSPDALQAYAASLGMSYTKPDAASASVATALSGNAAGIGLRTQSITLMRDSLYRICESYANGVLNHTDVVQLLQRSQDLTLGVLAIEQLTGAVAARQPVLTSAAGIVPSGNLTQSTEELNKAKKAEVDAQVAYQKALEDYDTVAKEFKKKKDGEEAARAIKDDGEAELAAWEKANTALKTETENLQKADSKVKTTKAEYDDAKLVVLVRREELRRTVNAVQVGASGNGEFTSAYLSSPPSSESVGDIAAATQAIVALVVNKGRLTEMCQNLISSEITSPDQNPKFSSLMIQCDKVIAANVKAYEQAVATTLAMAEKTSTHETTDNKGNANDGKNNKEQKREVIISLPPLRGTLGKEIEFE